MRLRKMLSPLVKAPLALVKAPLALAKAPFSVFAILKRLVKKWFS